MSKWILIVFIFLFTLPISTASEINSCTNITQPGYYSLGGDIVGVSVGICINIMSDDVIFDGKMHAIQGSGEYGIHAFSRSNVSVINVTVSGWKNGIGFDYVDGGRIENVNASFNDFGIKLNWISNCTISNNIAMENEEYDIYFNRYCNNIIENNIGSGNREIGFYNYPVTVKDESFSALFFCNADHSVVEDVIVSGSENRKNNGIFVFYTDVSIFRNVRSSENAVGIKFVSSSNNVIEDSQFSFNRYSGIEMVDQNSTLVINNTLDSNYNGIYCTLCRFNLFWGNVLKSNTGYGMFFGMNSHNNTVRGNQISMNSFGILFDNSSNNLVHSNKFDNARNFIILNSTNVWNTTAGNFWSDYLGSDSNMDGIGDIPYFLDQNNIDFYPLVPGELIPDNIDDVLEKIVSKYNPSFDWKTQTPSRQIVLQSVTNAVIAYFSTDDPTVKHEILGDVVQLVMLYFVL